MITCPHNILFYQIAVLQVNLDPVNDIAHVKNPDVVPEEEGLLEDDMSLTENLDPFPVQEELSEGDLSAG